VHPSPAQKAQKIQEKIQTVEKPIVLKKAPNKIGNSMAEALEGRPVTKGNSEETTANCTQGQEE
jgi:hypothetical protein